MGGCVYLTATGPASGKSAVVLGVMELLSRHVERVGFFRPIVQDLPDSDVELVRARYGLPDDRVGVAFTSDDLRELDGGAPTVENGGLERALAAYKQVEAVSDIVVVEGSDFTGASAPLGFELNARLARELGGPVVGIVNGHELSTEEIVDLVLVSEEDFRRRGLAIAATIVNRVPAGQMDELATTWDRRHPDSPPVWTLPEIGRLRQPSIAELAAALDATVIAGHGDDLERTAVSVEVAAMTVPNMLDRISAGAVLITPGDRADLLLAAAATLQSTAHPSVAGIIVSGGITPDPRVISLIDGMGTAATRLPLLLVEPDTFRTAIAAGAVEGAITAENGRKIQAALDLFERRIGVNQLAERIEVATSGVVTPLMFQYELVSAAREVNAHLVFPEGTEPRVLEATDRLMRRRVCDVTLLGSEAEVRRRIADLGLDHLSALLANGNGDESETKRHLQIIDPATSSLLEEFAEEYRRLRAHKGTTLDQARDIVVDVSFFGSMMVHQGLADGMVSGAAHTTAHTVRPALEFIKTRPDVSIVSSVFFMLLADRVLVYGDCAVVPDPDADQLADIAISSAETAKQFGIEPRIAMLSYSTGGSSSGADVEKVRAATERVRRLRPDLPVEGPIQYDAAIDSTVGEAKLPGSEVAGRATVFVFPDLNTGNNTYKAVQRSADAMAVGPVLQGLNKPVNDLSRGTTVDDIVNTAAITAIQSLNRPE